LILEYAARNAKRYGGVIGFSGGLIGDRLNKKNYKRNCTVEDNRDLFAGYPGFRVKVRANSPGNKRG